MASEPTSSLNPSVFGFTDYREFLRSFHEARKAADAGYSMSTFTRRAGLGANSRGYLKLIMEGKRNLTPHTIRRFAEAMELGPKEAMHFESLVYFNQARTAKDREYYLKRISVSAHG